MDFKQALIAHLNGDAVEVHGGDMDGTSLLGGFGHIGLGAIEKMSGEKWRFRIKPRTVTVNGIECVAPETVAPAHGTTMYTAHPAGENWYARGWWNSCEAHMTQLQRGLVFLCEEHAVAYAKAMCGQKV